MMKTVFGFFFLAITIFTACKKNNAVPDETLNELPDTTNALIVLKDIFNNGSHGQLTSQVFVLIHCQQYNHVFGIASIQ